MRHSTKRLALTGQRFGKLTVVSPAENVGARTAWLCRCDCGNEVVVTTARLRDGRRTSCGCDKVLNGYTPAEIGRASLTYIDGTCVEMIRARTKRCNNTSGVPGVDWMAKKQRWRASICFKGKRRYLGSYEKFEDAVRARKRAEKDIFDAFLDVCSGKVPENELRDIGEICPPIARDYGEQRLDLTGQQFGMLTVLEPAENIGSMTAWRCLCACGKETVVMTGHLRGGHTTSCGCKPTGTFVDGTFVELIRAGTIRRNNTSGVTGVEWVPAMNKWKAIICFKGERHYLGCYRNFEDAVMARKQGEERFFGAFLREWDDAANRVESGDERRTSR